MDENIIIVGIVFGSVVAIVVLSLIFNLIQTSIKSKKGHYDDEAFHRMAQAFIQHKNDMERRVKNIEAIVTNDETFSSTKDTKTQSKIEIDEPESTVEIQYEDSKISNHLRSK